MASHVYRVKMSKSLVMWLSSGATHVFIWCNCDTVLSRDCLVVVLTCLFGENVIELGHVIIWLWYSHVFLMNMK